MNFRQTLRSDTPMSAIFRKLERHHGAINCSWRLYTHSYSASNEIRIDMKSDSVTLAQIYGDIGQPSQELAPEYELWYNYELDERYESDPILLIWPSS